MTPNQKKTRVLLVLGILFCLLSVGVALATLFIISHPSSSSVFGSQPLTLNEGANKINGHIKEKESITYRYSAPSYGNIRVNVSEEQPGIAFHVKKALTASNIKDSQYLIRNLSQTLVCAHDTVYIGVTNNVGETDFSFEVQLQHDKSDESDCGLAIPPSLLVSGGIGAIFLLVGILFLALACVYKRRDKKRGYVQMSETMNDSHENLWTL